jgi:hypothetical protein
VEQVLDSLDPGRMFGRRHDGVHRPCVLDFAAEPSRVAGDLDDHVAGVDRHASQHLSKVIGDIDIVAAAEVATASSTCEFAGGSVFLVTGALCAPPRHAARPRP